MKLSKKLAIIFPITSENKTRYESEAWLLPYKPLDTDEASCNVPEKPDYKLKANKIKIERDSKNRRILSKDSLFQEIRGLDDIPGTSTAPAGPSTNLVSTNTPGPSTVPSPIHYPGFISSLSTPAESDNVAPGRKHTERSKKVQQVKLNPFQRKFEKAVATPVMMSKAESMMLKMGWSGGALGRTGAGITEPIVPNLAYATSTKGFGQSQPQSKPSKKTNKQTKPKVPSEKELIRLEKRKQRLYRRALFRENVLRYILEFVKNEREIGIVFEESLLDRERKAIHSIVEEIRNLRGLDIRKDAINASYNRLMLLNIASKNRYVLQTQSEGMHPHRYLCLFKEAPETMYLVTHFKLNDKESIFVKSEEVQCRTKSKKKTKKRERIRLRQEQSMNKNKNIVKESIKTNTIGKIGGDDNNKNVKDESQYGKDSISDDDTDGLNDMLKYILGDDGIDESDEVSKTVDIDEEINELVERTAAGACRITKKDQVVEIDAKGYEIENIPSKNDDIETNESLFGNDKEYIANNEKMDLKNDQEIDDAKQKTIETSTITITPCSRKEFMRYNLNMCFSDFIVGSAYEEFKFLGDFDEEEFEVLNEFLRDFFLVKDNMIALDEEFMDVWDKAKCKLAFKRDIHGGIVIYKVF